MLSDKLLKVRFSLRKPVTLPQTLARVRPLSQKARPIKYEVSIRGQKQVVPELLRVFHAGKANIAFIGLIKLLPLVLFGTNLAYNAYGLFKWSGYNLKRASISIAISAFPLLFVVVAAPFVTVVHLRLPLQARRSRDAVTQFASRLPSDTKLAFTTISWYGRPRLTWMELSELRPTKSKLGIQDIVRIVPDPVSKKGQWSEPVQTEFFVDQPKTRTFESTVWDKVLAKIQSKGNLK